MVLEHSAGHWYWYPAPILQSISGVKANITPCITVLSSRSPAQGFRCEAVSEDIALAEAGGWINTGRAVGGEDIHSGKFKGVSESSFVREYLKGLTDVTLYPWFRTI